MRAWSIAAALILAGCSSPASPGGGQVEAATILEAPDWAIAALANGKNHDHYHAPDHANRTTPNFVALGHDALETERADGPSGGYLCGDVGTTAEGRDIAVTQSHVDDVVLVVADVTDPNAPFMVGELVVNGLSTYDAAITDDAAFAVVAVSGGSLDTVTDPDGVEARFSLRTACGVSHGPFVRALPVPSILLVDLGDPAAPTIVDQAIVPGIGVHSVSTATIDGTEYVAASSTGLLPAALTNFVFFTIERHETLGPTLVPFGHYDGSNAQSRTAGYGTTNLHTDATIAKHPKTGQVLAYLANWNGGMVVVELVERGLVLWQSEWGASSSGVGLGGLPGGLGGGFSVHSTLPLPDLWGDRHVTVVGEETITPRTGMPSGLVILIDTTDPTAPAEVARWTLPVDAGGWDEPLIYSPHYMTVVNHTVFVSMYHGGVWAFNATPEHWPYPPTTGMFLPAAPNPNAPEPGTSSWAVLDFAPSIAEVLAKSDGTLVSFDSHGGVYTYRYLENGLVEPVANWFETH